MGNVGGQQCKLSSDLHLSLKIRQKFGARLLSLAAAAATPIRRIAAKRERESGEQSSILWRPTIEAERAEELFDGLR